MMRSPKSTSAAFAPATDPIPFPGLERHNALRSLEGDAALAALNNVSRRLEDLARKLNCLGYFDETDPDRPRAA